MSDAETSVEWHVGRRPCVLLLCSVLALLAGVCEGETVRVSGRDYTLLRSARHASYNVALQLQPSGEAARFESVDVLFAYREGAPSGRFCWTRSGFVLERVHGGEAVVVAAGDTPLPAAVADGAELVLKRRRHWLEIVADRRRVLRVLEGELGRGQVGIVTGPGGPSVGSSAYQRIEPVVFGDDFMRTEEETSSFGLWEPAQGKWRLHSVMEEIRANPDARIREGREPVAARSSNPFCLSGAAQDGAAVILTGYPFWDDHTVGVSIKPAAGECGVVFGAADGDSFWVAKWRVSSQGVRAGPVALIHRHAGIDRVVATGSHPGRTGNWYRLAVRAAGGRITVSIDGQPVAEARDDRSVGGRIGVYADSTEETYFDDVTLATDPVVRFDSVAALAGHGTVVSGEWRTGREGGVFRFEGRGATADADSGGRGQQGFYVVGHPAWEPRNIRVRLTCSEPGSGGGLVFGYAGPDDFWRLSLVAAEAGARLSLAQRANGAVRDVASVIVPQSGLDSHLLELELTESGILGVFVDGERELRVACDTPPSGRLGLHATGVGAARFQDFEAFSARRRDWEQPVNVEVFADDPFMQGWASPRWAWVELKGTSGLVADGSRLLVHKGDFYGAFRLAAPVSDGLSVYFGRDDVEPDAGYAVRLTVDDERRKGNAVLLRSGVRLGAAEFEIGPRTVIPGKQVIDEKIGPQPRTPDTVSYGELVLERDGKVIWLSVAGKDVLSVRDPEPLRGRALGLGVAASIDLLHVSVLRGNVKDYLFERAPVDWTAVGTWEVTNRFACDPRWSHMNGRSKGVAALWNKHAFEGDFTLEYYAGMRMRQGEMLEGAARAYYPRIGDINVALNADGFELFSGYNLILAAWDPLWSERWTQFWRRDSVLEQTDREFIPRGRDAKPTARAIEVEWDPGGRPVHGAWYFVKLRKTGSRYDVSFDNVPVFSAEDPDPLTGRRLALWTQQNSIVIARAKIGYERLGRPGVAAPDSVTAVEPVPAAAVPEVELVCESHPGHWFDFESGDQGWGPYDGDQSAELSACTGGPGRGKRSLLLRNLHSGGDFGVRLPVQGLDLGRVAEMGFDCVIPEGVAVNLYVVFEHEPLERYFIPLTGPDLAGADAPNFYRLGRFTTTGLGGGWTRRRFRPAAAVRQFFPWRDTFVVSEMVLGMLHEGYLTAGSTGNRRGASWQVDNVMFASVGSKTARCRVTGAEDVALRYKAWCSRSPAAQGTPTDVPESSLATTELSCPERGLWFLHVAAAVEAGWRLGRPVPVWVDRRPEVTAIAPADGAEWDGAAVVLTFQRKTRWEPDLGSLTLSVADQAVPLEEGIAAVDVAARTLTVDLAAAGIEFADGQAVTLRLGHAERSAVPALSSRAAAALGTAAGEAAQSVAPTGSAAATPTRVWQCTVRRRLDRTPPSVVRLDREQHITMDFNRGLEGISLYSADSQTKVTRTVRDADSGDYAVRILNRLCGSNFGVKFGVDRFFAGEFPVLAFDYRANADVRADFALRPGQKPKTIGFTDRDSESSKLGDIPGIATDGTWRHAEANLASMMTRLSDDSTPRSTSAYRVSGFALGDWGYSAMPPGVWLELDNVVLVPAVSTHGGLGLNWASRDVSGIRGYSYVWSAAAVTEVDETVDTADSSARFTDVPEGESFLHIRAQDNAGNWGRPARYRFLVDNTPPAVADVSPAPDSKAASPEIKVRFGESLAGIDPTSIRLTLNGRKCSLSSYTTKWDSESREFSWNMLSASRVSRGVIPDGQEMAFSLSGLKDFAGNVAAPFEWRWHVDYAQDRQGPLAPRLYSYVYDFRYYDHFSTKSTYWRPYGKNNAAVLSTVIDDDTGDSCLCVEKADDAQRFSVYRYRGKLALSDYPMLSFDCKIMPGVKVNLLLYVKGGWQVVGMTGDTEETDLGRIEEARDDGKWHHLVVNLQALLREAIPDEESPEIRLVALGEWRGNTNKKGARFYVDNFAFIGPAPPVPVFSCMASDVTGIGGFQVGFDQNPKGLAVRDLPATVQQSAIGSADKPGLWYIHLRARDGAGNWGHAVHYPYYVVQPLAAGAVEGMEGEPGWEGYTSDRRSRCQVHPVAADDTTNGCVAAELYMAQSTMVRIRRRPENTMDLPERLTADFYHHGDKPMTVSAYVVPEGVYRRIASSEIEVQGRTWVRDVPFDFDLASLTGRAGGQPTKLRCRELGFMVRSEGKVRTGLVIDSVRSKPLGSGGAAP